MPAKRKGRSQEFIDDSDDPEDTRTKTKMPKTEEKPGGGASEKADEMIPLSAKRFVNVRTFNGKVLVDIREYYDDANGDRKPGRKGISLSLDQWEKLQESSKDINSKIDELRHPSDTPQIFSAF